ncbi:hypothetical protein W04_0405 [Pseudoalteromonas sp. SW0106-04]|uniref:hypothetical protein n=1 Tax=Pseudoalteromonas sp. SW0106-04 TaxID=1702169 RepID=UPI0006B4898A|nr:hypothetical protein [Pseudoalteromonas sp. SW0106-04]GAP73894.1 hypothetical protein W04_0405 [Pseudoalteromonas sp. SW0106-04]
MTKLANKRKNTLLSICVFCCIVLSLSWLFINDSALLLAITLLMILLLVWGIAQRLLSLWDKQQPRK